MHPSRSSYPCQGRGWGACPRQGRQSVPGMDRNSPFPEIQKGSILLCFIYFQWDFFLLSKNKYE